MVASSMTIIDVARWLKKRMESGERTNLFLGARAGGLYRSKTLYSTSQGYSPRTFQNMTQVKQFRECYRVLCEVDFSRSDIDSILVASLSSLKGTEADLYLASFVQMGIFDTIISTNIDNVLPTVFEESGMKQGEDFQIFIPQQHSFDEILSDRYKSLSTFMKISGDLQIGEYNLFKHNLYLETHQMLKTILSSILDKPMLMIGYDPFWDRALDALLPAEGQEIWYVNEENPEESPDTSMFIKLQSRKSKYIIGGDGGYESFMQKLHWHLDEGKETQEGLLQSTWENARPITGSLNGTKAGAPGGSITSKDAHMYVSEHLISTKEQRTFVFIGYDHRDKFYLEKLKAHMAHHEREKLLTVWDDRKVKPGTNYQHELQLALNNTRVAILLVSSNFTASDFIASDILPPLLQTAEEGGAIILPLIIRPCVFEATALQQFQPFNDPAKPLSSKNANGKDRVLADLVRYVQTLVRNIEHE